MKIKSKIFSSILIRYILLLIVAIPGLWLFYIIFTPLTVYPVYYLLSLFYDVSIKGQVVNIAGIVSIELIGACIAGSAYYLLLILNLSIQKIKISKRIKLLIYSFLAFLIINILRIFILSVLYMREYSGFELTHQIFWYVGSIVIVILIWFVGINIYKVKEIPFYNDLKFLYKELRK